MSNSFNPPQNVTSGPNNGTCGSCHTGNLQGEIVVDGIPEDGVEAGETYALNITVRKENQGTRAGFQLGIFNASGSKVGTFQNPSSGSAIEGNLWEHRPAQQFGSENEVSWAVDWVAPNDVSDLTMYASSVVADGNNMNSMDGVLTFSLEVEENTVSNMDVNNSSWRLLRIGSHVIVENFERVPFDLDIFNIQGSLIHTFHSNGVEKQFDTDLENGLMIGRIRTSDGVNVVTKI